MKAEGSTHSHREKYSTWGGEMLSTIAAFNAKGVEGEYEEDVNSLMNSFFPIFPGMSPYSAAAVAASRFILLFFLVDHW